MLPVWMSICLFGPIIAAAIFLILRRRRGIGAMNAPGPRVPSDTLIRELSRNEYRR